MTSPGETPDAARLVPDAERLNSLAEFAAGAGHEINNPLATIVGRVQQLLRGEADVGRQQALKTIAAQAYRIRDMIGDAMLFARPPAPQFQHQSLETLIERVAAAWRNWPVAESFPLEIGFVPAVELHVDSAQFSVAVHEVLRNAAEAMSAAPAPIRIVFERDEHMLVVGVCDHGKGMTVLEQRHAFDPFYSGRAAGRGLGFGLCKVWRVVTLHGGRVEIETGPEGPTTVRLWWPLSRAD